MIDKKELRMKFREALVTTITEKEQEITSLKDQITTLKEDLYSRISNLAAVILIIVAGSGWITALWVYLQCLKDFSR